MSCARNLESSAWAGEPHDWFQRRWHRDRPDDCRPCGPAEVHRCWSNEPPDSFLSVLDAMTPDASRNPLRDGFVWGVPAVDGKHFHFSEKPGQSGAYSGCEN